MTVLIVITSLLCVLAAVGAFLALNQMFYWMGRSNAHLRDMLEAKKEAIALKLDLELAQAELWRRATELSRAEDALRRALKALDRHDQALAPPLLDDKTKSLVRLAISNSEEHEQHAAAMLVCRRLMERMGP